MLTCEASGQDKKTTGQYHGQTESTMYSLMKEHNAGLGAKKLSCPLYKHKLDQHKVDEPEFEMMKV